MASLCCYAIKPISLTYLDVYQVEPDNLDIKRQYHDFLFIMHRYKILGYKGRQGNEKQRLCCPNMPTSRCALERDSVASFDQSNVVITTNVCV